MLRWNNIITYVNKGNPTPSNRVEKSKEEWAALLTDDQFFVTRLHGTERSFSNELCQSFDPGLYSVSVVIVICLTQVKNLNLPPVGQVLHSP